MSIWSLVIEGDGVSVSLFANKEDLYAHLRREWLVPDEVSDEDAAEWVSEEAYNEVDVHIEEHPVPEPSKLTYHVRINFDGTVVSKDFDRPEEAVQICRAFNTDNPGGRYGVYDSTGKRV